MKSLYAFCDLFQSLCSCDLSQDNYFVTYLLIISCNLVTCNLYPAILILLYTDPAILILLYTDLATLSH